MPDTEKILPHKTGDNIIFESVETTRVETLEIIISETAETIAPEIEDTLAFETYADETTVSEKLTSEATLWDYSINFTENSYSSDADCYDEDLYPWKQPSKNDKILPKLKSILEAYSDTTRVAVATFWLWESDEDVFEEPLFDGKSSSELYDEWVQLSQARFNIEMQICEENGCSRKEAQKYDEYIEVDRLCNEAYELVVNAEEYLTYLRWEPSREYLRSFGLQIEYDRYSDNPIDTKCYMEFLDYKIVFVGTVKQVKALISDLEGSDWRFALGLALDKDLYDDLVNTYGDPHMPPFLINGEVVEPHK